jgi:protoporphyrinogen/coproporphyrinogen III oxidase
MSVGNSRPRAVVVGGGIGGLSTAFFLKDRADVLLVEASSRLGGVIQTVHEDGFTMEAGPDCFISEKPAGLKLAEELGLKDELIGTNPEFRQSFILSKGSLVPVPKDFYLMAPKSFPAFFFSSLLSWHGKLRAAAELWVKAAGESEDESLSSFVTRRFGREMLDRVAQPMLAGIYTADPDELSLKATMPRFHELERQYGSVIRGLRAKKLGANASGPRYGLFVSFRNGMDTLIEALKQKIASAQILVNHKVENISRQPTGGWSVKLHSGETLQADLLYLALPAHACSKLLAPSAPTLSQALGKIPYASSATMNVVYKTDQIRHPMNGMGFVVPNIEKRNLAACSFTFRKFRNRAPEGFALLRAFLGGAQKGILDRSDSEIEETIHQELAEILSIEGRPVRSNLQKWDKSMAQYSVGHLERAEVIESELQKIPNLFLVGNAYRGVGIPDVIASAERAVRMKPDLDQITCPPPYIESVQSSE